MAGWRVYARTNQVKAHHACWYFESCKQAVRLSGVATAGPIGRYLAAWGISLQLH
jgi:hypothetical protein